MTKRTDFGKAVMKKLIDLDKSSKWLQEEITSRTGLFVDSAYLSKATTGQYVSPKLIDAICDVLNLPKPDYSGASDSEKEE